MALFCYISPFFIFFFLSFFLLHHLSSYPPKKKKRVVILYNYKAGQSPDHSIQRSVWSGTVKTYFTLPLTSLFRRFTLPLRTFFLVCFEGGGGAGLPSSPVMTFQGGRP